MAEAEKIKIRYGTCNPHGISNDELIKVPGMGGRESRMLPRQILAEILEPRMEEIFTLVKRETFRAGMETVINSGVVLTGGSSLLEGATDIAEVVFGVPTRLGTPRNINGLIDVVNNPMYATGVGLVLYGAQKEPEKRFRIRDRNIFNSLISRMKKWFKDVI
jgi:cell division protein FtsA